MASFLPFRESKLVFEWPRRIAQSKFFILFSSRRHDGRTRRLCGADLHGCAVGLQNRTHRHNAPHAAEQTAAPTCVSGLCRSSPVNSPPAGGIGVRVLPASCVLVPKRDACAFLAQQEKPKRRQILVLFRRIFRFSFCTSHEIQHFCASDAVVAM